jgi:hypothetical protein
MLLSHVRRIEQARHEKARIREGRAIANTGFDFRKQLRCSLGLSDEATANHTCESEYSGAEENQAAGFGNGADTIARDNG